MTKQATEPSGVRWKVRRTVVRGRSNAGRRWRWRGPWWLRELAELLQLGQLAEIPIIGVIFAVPALIVLAVLLLVLLPVIAIALVEAVVLAIALVVGLAAAVLVGRPLLVRAVRDGDTDHLAWAVRGLGRSKAVRDHVCATIEAGLDLRTAPPPDATLVYDQHRAD